MKLRNYILILILIVVYFLNTSSSRVFPVPLWFIHYESENVTIKYNRKHHFNHNNNISLTDSLLELKYQGKEIEEINKDAAYEAYIYWEKYGKFENRKLTDKLLKALLNESSQSVGKGIN